MPRRLATYRPPGWEPARTGYERARPRAEDKAFYSSAAWVALRNVVRAEEPLCRLCLAGGVTRLGLQVDHVLPRKARPDLALDRDNLQNLCRPCHNAKRKAEA